MIKLSLKDKIFLNKGHYIYVYLNIHHSLRRLWEVRILLKRAEKGSRHSLQKRNVQTSKALGYVDFIQDMVESFLI